MCDSHILRTDSSRFRALGACAVTCDRQLQSVLGLYDNTRVLFYRHRIGRKSKTVFPENAGQDGSQDDCRKRFPDTNMGPQAKRDVGGPLSRTECLGREPIWGK